MSEKREFQIEVEAARALVQWKALFAEEVGQRAKPLVDDSDESPTLTLEHYRQAAEMAIQTLSTAVRDRGERVATSEAA